MRKNILLLLLINFSLLEHANTRKRFKTLLFRSIETNYNPEYLDAFYANISRNHYSMTMVMRLLKDSPDDFWMQVGILHKDSASKFRPMFSYNINVCSILGKELNKFSLVHLWMNNLLKYSNMPRICPWKADTYYWRDLRPEKDSIPDFVLSGLYRINTKFYFRELGNALFTNFSMLVDIKMK